MSDAPKKSDEEVLKAQTIFMEDIRRSGHCISGAKVWLGQNGWDFKDVLKNGLNALELREKHDGNGDQVLRSTLRSRGIILDKKV